MNLEDALIDTNDSVWARFLGTHLPPRLLDLRLGLLVPHRRGARPELKPPRVRALYTEQRENRRALLATVTEHARTLNRWQMPPAARCELAEIGLWTAVPAARELVMQALSEPGGVPETAPRVELLESIATTLQVLLIAYLLVFEADYAKSRFWYSRARPRVYLCAQRILDLIGLLQQVRALRYQRLSGAQWRIAHTVFRVMLECEQVEVPLETLGSLFAPRRGRDPRSLRDLYGSLQIPWVLDLLCWPESLYQFVLDYCRGIPDAVRILLSETPSGPRQAAVGCYSEREPGPAAVPQAEGLALVLDYSVLVTQAGADFAEVRKSRAARNPYLLPRRFGQLDPTQQLVAGYLMVNACDRRPIPWSATRRRAEDLDLRVHTGFQDIFEHLVAIFDPRGFIASRRELANLFAQRSAAIGEDHTTEVKSLWHILLEAPGRLRLQTQETRFTHRLSIGSFLVYGVGDLGVRQPRLGKVTRIHRPDAGFVQVDILEFADYARPLAVNGANANSGAAAPVRALFAFSPDSGWSILLPNDDQFWEDARITLIGGGQELPAELGELRDLGENYCLFHLKARINGPERPEYPPPELQGESGAPRSSGAPRNSAAPPRSLGAP